MESTLSETFLLNLISNSKVEKYIKPGLYVWHKYTSALLIFIVTVSSLHLVVGSNAITCMPVKNCAGSNDTLCRNNPSILYLSSNLSTSEKSFIDARCAQEHFHVLTEYLPLLMLLLSVVVIVLPTLLRTMIPSYERMVDEFLSLVKECDESSEVFTFIRRWIQFKKESPANTDIIPIAEAPSTVGSQEFRSVVMGENAPKKQPTTSSNDQCDKYVKHIINNKIVTPSNKDTGETEKKKFFALIDKASDYRKKYHEGVRFGTLQLIIVILCVVIGVIFILIIVLCKKDLGLLPKFLCDSEDLVESLPINSDYIFCFDAKAKYRKVALIIFAVVLILKSLLDVIMEVIVKCVGECSKDEDTVATESTNTNRGTGEAKSEDEEKKLVPRKQGKRSSYKCSLSSYFKFSCCTSGKLMKNLFAKMKVINNSDIVYFMSRLNLYDLNLCQHMIIIMHPNLEEYGYDNLKANLLSSADEAVQSSQKKEYDEKFMEMLTHIDETLKEILPRLVKKTDQTVTDDLEDPDPEMQELLRRYT